MNPARWPDWLTLPPMPTAEAGSYQGGKATYSSIGEFVDERPQRLYSRERDVGLRWRDGAAIYRAAWIEDTGELYLVQLGPPDKGGGHVELLAAALEIEELEESAPGWREAQDDGDHSLDWLRDHVRLLLARRDAVAARAYAARTTKLVLPREGGVSSFWAISGG